MGFFRALYISHPRIVAYMLQSTEYNFRAFLAWYWRTNNFANVTRRRSLDQTRRAIAVMWLLRAGMLTQFVAGIIIITLGIRAGFYDIVFFGFAVAASCPIVWAHIIILPLFVAKKAIVAPRQRAAIARSETKFSMHPGIKVAIAGSYGKTSMKELLRTILSESRNVAATPANRNVAIAHAQFIGALEGDEDVLLIEYGEETPGDIARFAWTTHPDYGLITGLAPVHLESYKTVAAAAADLASLTDFVPMDHLFINGEVAGLQKVLQSPEMSYTRKGVGNWKVSDVVVSIKGTSFSLQRGKETLHLKSGLLGRHNVGPIAAAAVLALELGMEIKDIESGVANTQPFEHRMMPRTLGGATIIDDTYNGNLEGIRAGTELLGELDAARKWYVTPGLVEQGTLGDQNHKEMGELIALARPDIVVLMENSATASIKVGLISGNYSGEIRIESNPLEFYTHLEHFVSTGDLVLMQNDWTDNYA